MYDDADPLKRVEEKKQEWSSHRQIGTKAQKLDDKRWKNENLLENPPRRRKRAAARCKKQQIIDGCGNQSESRERKIIIKANELDVGAALLVDLAKACERLRLELVCRWAMQFDFPRQLPSFSRGYFEHQRRVQFDGCVAGRLQTNKSRRSCQDQSCGCCC